MLIKSKGLAVFLYKLSFMRYAFVGGTTFAIDFFLLVLLHGYFEVDLGLATTISYWTAIAYNFSLNRAWTFSANDREDLRKHTSLYLLLLGFNYLFTLVFVSTVSLFISFAIAKILAVAISVSWTYYMYKNYIFISNKKSKKAL